jgi:hypothetical protein
MAGGVDRFVMPIAVIRRGGLPTVARSIAVRSDRVTASEAYPLFHSWNVSRRLTLGAGGPTAKGGSLSPRVARALDAAQ